MACKTKEVRNAYARAYYAAHREKHLELCRVYRATHKESKAATGRAYYLEHQSVDGYAEFEGVAVCRAALLAVRAEP